MSKFLIILLLLAGSSLFVGEAFALEVEIQKESDRIIESRGWIAPELHSFKEVIKIIIDQENQQSRVIIAMLSTHPNDIIFPEYIEAISSNPRITAFTLTNEFGCAPNQIERGCIIIEVGREGLGDTLEEIRKNSREIADKIVGDGVIVFAAEFDSVKIKPKIGFDGKKISVAQVLYTTNKQATDNLFNALSTLLINSEIRESGGFYNNAKELSKHHFSDFTISFAPGEERNLRSLSVSLKCSSKLPDLPNCPNNFDELFTTGEINPLQMLNVENINRSEIFTDEFLPLNSIVEVLIFSTRDLQVNSANSNIIEKFDRGDISGVQEPVWFFASKSGKEINGLYIFGTEMSASKNDLIFSIRDNTVDDNEGGGGCLIATAAFGSELSSQVQFLRELRDNTVLQTQSGTSFMTGFNQFYYSFSPTIADYERENPAFKEVVKITLTPLLTSLTLLQYADIDSESEMLGYGIGIILLNIGIYFVAPAVLIMKVKKRI